MTETQSRYRGYHAEHPSLIDAAQGRVIPGNPKGTITLEIHNRGGQSENSPFTSWTTDREIARRFALDKGPGGILLTLPAGAPKHSETWAWEHSPDAWGEDEILLRGERSGATVELL
jgi:hypothetical protein